jgi:hypothetical protein
MLCTSGGVDAAAYRPGGEFNAFRAVGGGRREGPPGRLGVVRMLDLWIILVLFMLEVGLPVGPAKA